ncbi:sulfurtransferase TusA family protein [Pseudohoeflea coraliihabitans]|uniref:Sulfurtransferase TusA family protein n=1 Tax=Pseudohoeflea coraliihabitans TaxID=2860393 RepID=A0ABS6WKR3_9HYPH|nr:sulfurtransferase TusA family protein [Pseudohoeflea sp. DP4N28-3]MBW3096546.1 sulfurtransferase TusA family protein [Pseudohoeflea sp. DP4N28-3]
MAQAEVVLDLKGLKCPLPVMRTRRHLRSCTAGTIILVETTDPLAVIDLPHFCQQEGHRLLESQPRAEGHAFLIEKSTAAEATTAPQI